MAAPCLDQANKGRARSWSFLHPHVLMEHDFVRSGIATPGLLSTCVSREVGVTDVGRETEGQPEARRPGGKVPAAPPCAPRA